MQKTVLFEQHYNVDVGQFRTTDDIDRFLEQRSGQKLGVAHIHCNVVDQPGNILRIERIDTDDVIDKIICQ